MQPALCLAGKAANASGGPGPGPNARSKTMIQTIYKIPAPDAILHVIEVYGDPDMAWYEWRIIDAQGRPIIDTRTRQYGCAELALRDALIHASA